MDLSLRISRIIFMFSFCSLRTNHTILQKWTLKKNTKQKSKNEDNDSDLQSKADSDKDNDSETVIGKVPPKNKNLLAFCDGFRMSPVGSRRVLRC